MSRADRPACGAAAPRGIRCPACLYPRFWVETTREARPGVITRVRRCRHCGHRIRTAERVEAAA